MNRRCFINTVLAAPALTAVAASGSRPHRHSRPDQTSIADLNQQFASGESSSHKLTVRYLQRIRSIDRRGPALRSVIITNPEALQIARERDLERRAGKPRGWLHGMPILLKDNIDTGDQMPTTAGSLALAGTRAPQDAFVTRRLREAGAVILGKTNLSEWANIRSTNSSSGWSAVGGQTLNPYVLNRSPSGSSSGSAAAVAAGLCAAAIGTETDGSIVSPASACSIVGLKPTVGLVSRTGIIPIAHSQDTAGPMTRTVADAARVLNAIVGCDPADPATAASARHISEDYTKFLDRDGLKGARIGVARQFFGEHPEVDHLIEEHLRVLSSLGATLIDPVKFPHLREFGGAEYTVLLYELKHDLAAYLATRGDSVRVHSLADVIAFNEEHRELEMPFFGQETFLRAEARGPLTDRAYIEARERCVRFARTEGLDAILREHELDAIVAPSQFAPPWLIDHVNGDSSTGGCSSLPAVAGYPHLTVPAGYVRGLPVGISFFGAAWSEGLLLRYGYAFEQATMCRETPRFLATAEDPHPPEMTSSDGDV